MARVLCRNCGSANSRTARFCAGCGHDVHSVNDSALVTAGSAGRTMASEQDKHTLPEQTVATLRSLPLGAALLVVAGGETVGRGFRMEAEVLTAGRHPGSDIVLDDQSVSRHHAEFHRHGDTYLIRDLGGLNGTYVNHERVEEAALTSRDEIRLGTFHLVYLTA